MVRMRARDLELPPPRPSLMPSVVPEEKSACGRRRQGGDWKGEGGTYFPIRCREQSNSN